MISSQMNQPCRFLHNAGIDCLHSTMLHHSVLDRLLDCLLDFLPQASAAT